MKYRYQLQDLRCMKCHEVSSRQMALRCHCSGKLAADDSAETFAHEIYIMVKIARFHGFGWLEEVAKNLAH